MRNKLKLFLLFLLFANITGSIIVSLSGIFKGNYFKEYYNYKGLKSPELYMERDSLLYKSSKIYSHENEMEELKVKGVLFSNGNEIVITLLDKKYFNFSKDTIVLYRNRYSKELFLRDAPKEYYSSKIRGLILTSYLKISLLIFSLIIIYLIIKRLKYRL